MKKFFALMMVLVMVVSSAQAVFAAGEKLMSDTVTVFADIEMAKSGKVKESLRFNLFSESGEWLGNKCVDIVGEENIEVVFDVPEYEIGAKFQLMATTGAESVVYGETKYGLNEKITVETYASRNDAGEVVVTDDVHISVYPIVAKSELVSNTFTVFADVKTPDGIFIPSDLRINLFSENDEWLGNKCVRIEKTGPVEIVFEVPEYEIGTKFRLAATTGAEYISYYSTKYLLDEKITAETYAYRDEENNLVISAGVNVSVGPLFKEDTWYQHAEDIVNSRNIKSRTNHLIWVSKKDFKVSVFTKENGKWECYKYFACSIGAPGTPTITGQYEYHQYQPIWDYGSYYVGPIMRFYRGYAIHSTLVNKDGTDRDGRVGYMISHGCVRVRPENIQWLVKVIPMNTKIYITE